MGIEKNYSKFLAAQKLLLADLTSFSQLEAIKELVYGFNPKVDKALEKCVRALDAILKLQEGAVVELTFENLPAETENDKKRKKALLFLIKNLKDLKSEVDRVYKELSGNNGQQKSVQEQTQTFSKIFTSSKGLLGVVTIMAVLMVWGYLAFNKGSGRQAVTLASPPAVGVKTKSEYIVYIGKQIPVSETTKTIGPECDKDEHYHAKDHVSATASDNTIVMDPGGCGFGKVKNTQVIEQ